MGRRNPVWTASSTPSVSEDRSPAGAVLPSRIRLAADSESAWLRTSLIYRNRNPFGFLFFCIRFVFLVQVSGVAVCFVLLFNEFDSLYIISKQKLHENEVI